MHVGVTGTITAVFAVTATAVVVLVKYVIEVWGQLHETENPEA